MNEEAKFIFDQLRADGYPLFINKKQYAEIVGLSVHSIDSYITREINLPNYKKLGEAKNAKVVFNLKDVAEFLASRTVQTA